ncbi:glutathione S-transferase N-terminal domain-containing protein [Nevskia soli]|uniref:glutathione S-transferase N-terminal domain-containing protein n=1 Tax=Nevskia soli TaxID=418856 RepID=UPI00068C0765|nr:glutathione S-transferase N-terminal domain-containing protein [Nevskia soli]
MTLRTRHKTAQSTIKPAPNAGLMLFIAEDSLSCDWARLVLAEKDVDSAQIQTIRSGSAINEDFLVLNPSQSLPTLADREGVITGARVIVEYLDERYPHPPLMPLSPAARARVRMALQGLEHELLPRIEALPAVGARGAAAARGELLERLLAGGRHFAAQGYILGRDYTLVDSGWAVLLRRLGQLAIELPAQAEPLRRYAARLFARPAYQRCFNKEPGRKP